MIETLPIAERKINLGLLTTSNEVRSAIDGLPLDEQIAAIHDWFEPHIVSSGIRQFVLSNDRSHLAPEIEVTLQDIQSGQAQVIETNHSRYAIDCFERMRMRLRLADESTEGQPMEIQAAARLIGGWQIVTDADNTITDHNYIKKEMDGLVDPLLLGSRIADPLHGPHREDFPEVYAAIWKPLLEYFPEIFYEGGNLAPIRDGMQELFAYLQEQNIDITVVSTNFRPFIDALIQRVAPQPETVRRCTATTHTTHGTVVAEKGEILQIIAQAYPENTIVYIGDGTSDYPTIAENVRSIVAVYFALENSSFAKELEKLRQDDPSVVYFTYETGADIQKKLQEITAP